MDAHDIITALKQLPDFDCFPLPTIYHEQFKIPFPPVITPKEFYDSEYTIRCARERKELPPITIDTPIKDGFVYNLPLPEQVKIELISAPYTETNPPKILKGLVRAVDEPLDCLSLEEQEAIKKERVLNTEMMSQQPINSPDQSACPLSA